MCCTIHLKQNKQFAFVSYVFSRSLFLPFFIKLNCTSLIIISLLEFFYFSNLIFCHITVWRTYRQISFQSRTLTCVAEQSFRVVCCFLSTQIRFGGRMGKYSTYLDRHKRHYESIIAFLTRWICTHTNKLLQSLFICVLSIILWTNLYRYTFNFELTDHRYFGRSY